MANVSQIYKDAVDPQPKSVAFETELLKAEQQNILKWEEWRLHPTTKEFLKLLEDSRTELLVGKNSVTEMTFGIPDALLANPQIPADFLRIKLAEIGTLQKVLRATMDGKYNK
jgi:hypothetical protein